MSVGDLDVFTYATSAVKWSKVARLECALVSSSIAAFASAFVGISYIFNAQKIASTS